MDPQATAGRIVHYTDATDRATAAIVCVDAAPNGLAALTTFFPGKPPVPMREVPYSEQPAPGYWSWMPYQKAKADSPGGNQSEGAEPRPDIEPGSFEDFARRVFKDFLECLETLEGRVGGTADFRPFDDLEQRVEILEGRTRFEDEAKVTEPDRFTEGAEPSNADAEAEQVGEDAGDRDEAQETSPDDAGRADG